MNRKNRSGVRVVGALPEVKYSRNPIRIPMTTNRHDSVSRSEQVWSVGQRCSITSIAQKLLLL